MLSRFHLIPGRYEQTDGRTDGRMDRQTDRFAISISRVSMLTRDKNCSLVVLVCKSGMVFQFKSVRFRRSWTTA